MKTVIDLAGLEKLQKLARRDFSDALENEVRQIADDIRLAAKNELDTVAENDPKALAVGRSLTIETIKGGGSYSIGTLLEYGRTLEFGSVNSIESPWLSPALAKVGRNIRTRLRALLLKSTRRRQRDGD